MSKPASKPAKTAPAPAADVIDIDPAPSVALAANWKKARQWIDLSALYFASSCGCQVMAGMELLALHRHYEVKRGGDRRSNFHRESLKWDDALKAELNISVTTAWRWMEMAKVAKSRLAKDSTDLAALLDQPPAALSEAEREILKRAVHKITDGQTQAELMLEWGITKKGGGTPPVNHRPSLGGGEGSENGSGEGSSSSAAPEGTPPASTRIDADLLWWAQQLPELNIHLRLRCTWSKLALQPEACPRANLQNLHDLLAEALPAIAAHLEQHS